MVQPRFHRIEQWPAAFLSHCAPLVGTATTNLLLDNVELTDASDHLGGYRRFVQFIQVDEFSPSVSLMPSSA